MEPAPQVVVLAIDAAEERTEVIEFGAFEHFTGPAAADRVAIVGRNSVNLGGFKFSHAFAAQQRQGDGVIEREAEIGQQDPPPKFLGQLRQTFDQHGIDLQIGGGELAALGDRIEHKAGFLINLPGDGLEVCTERAAGLTLKIQRQHPEHRGAGLLTRFGRCHVDIAPLL